MSLLNDPAFGVALVALISAVASWIRLASVPPKVAEIASQVTENLAAETALANALADRLTVVGQELAAARHDLALLQARLAPDGGGNRSTDRDRRLATPPGATAPPPPSTPPPSTPPPSTPPPSTPPPSTPPAP